MRTTSLSDELGFELEMPCSPDTQLAAGLFLHWLGRELTSGNMEPGDTSFVSGTSTVELAREGDTVHVATDPGGSDDFLRLRIAQRSACFDAGSPFDPPPPTATCTVLVADRTVRLRRDQPINHTDSGWTLELEPHHADTATSGPSTVDDVIRTQPDIAPYLALSPGYVVELSHTGPRVRYAPE